MVQVGGVIICLGYIVGLLFTAIPYGGFIVLTLGIILAVFSRKRLQNLRKLLQKQETPGGKAKTISQLRQNFPHPKIWLAAGLIGLLASFYFQLRFPQPSANDISKLIPEGNNQDQLVIVRGEVLDTARINRNQRGQIWLDAKNINQVNQVKKDNQSTNTSKAVRGKLYVTLPILQSTGLYPGQQIDVTGTLYKPKPPSNPGAFDFQRYLQQEGAFAGMSGRLVTVLSKEKERPWGLWRLREKIVKSQARWLGIPNGPLVSAMVLGSKVIDLPYDVRDSFLEVGLAHALAASGFQTALILSVVLGLAARCGTRTKFLLGSLALIMFLGLAGFQPAVLRATIMGFAALIALLVERKVKQVGSLLFAATLLLLFNPLWIWDLGFQLSFLATLGLIVTVNPITEYMQWIPEAIACLIAVPIAAVIWTLPLQLYVFGTVPTYSVLLNIFSTPLVSVISLVGFISALAALVLPEAGSTIASILYYPTAWLIKLVEYFSNLPGNSVAIGTISTVQLIIIYTLLILSWMIPWWKKRWLLAGLISIGLILIPAWHSTSNLFRITVLASNQEPILVIQEQGKVTLVNSGDEGTGSYTILPFLKQQGVNQIDWAIGSDFQGDGSSGWLDILQKLPVKTFYDYSPSAENAIFTQKIQKQLETRQGTYQSKPVNQTINIGSVTAQLTNDKLPILQLQIQGQNWMLVGSRDAEELRQFSKTAKSLRPQVLWCDSESLQELVSILQPQVAITNNPNLDEKTLSELNQNKTKLFFTGRDGAIQWTPNGQFESFVQAGENKNSVL
jgi:competence protein ComEC